MKTQSIISKRARIISRSGLRRRRGKYVIPSGLSLSQLEDSPASYQEIRSLANRAGKNAAAEAKARGLSRVYLKDNLLIKVSQSGTSEILQPRIKREYFYIKYKPETVLHVTSR